MEKIGLIFRKKGIKLKYFGLFCMSVYVYMIHIYAYVQTYKNTFRRFLVLKTIANEYILTLRAEIEIYDITFPNNNKHQEEIRGMAGEGAIGYPPSLLPPPPSILPHRRVFRVDAPPPHPSSFVCL